VFQQQVGAVVEDMNDAIRTHELALGPPHARHTCIDSTPALRSSRRASRRWQIQHVREGLGDNIAVASPVQSRPITAGAVAVQRVRCQIDMVR